MQFISKAKAEEALKNCLYEIKEILNKDLCEVNLRNRTVKEWFKKFGSSKIHQSTKSKLQKLEDLRSKAEGFILFSTQSQFYPKGNSLEETWIA